MTDHNQPEPTPEDAAIADDLDETGRDNNPPAAPAGPIPRSRRQRRNARKVASKVAVLQTARELHDDLVASGVSDATVARPPKGLGRSGRSLWRSLEAHRVHEQMGQSGWIRNPPRWLGTRGRREFLQMERSAVRAKVRTDTAAGGLYTAEEQQRGALVLALLLVLAGVAFFVLTSCGA